MFTLMPSLAPSCKYGMIEWFHKSMNHCLNSATDTGHDRKKQGPGGGRFLLTGLYPNTFIMTTLSQVPKSDFAHSVC